MTPVMDLYAVRGTEFSEVIVLANDLGAPVQTNNAQALCVIRQYQGGPVLIELNNSHGISFGNSNMTLRLTEQELEQIQFRTVWYDLFLHLQNDVKKKIARGKLEIEP